jgi:3,4-dihydroxy 2-butanone 4-phosphate synthase/GTP cyclohydrolase II
MIDEIILKARIEINRRAYSKTSLAIAAGLHPNTLRNIDSDSFSPNYRTLRALEKLFSEQAE